MSRWTGSWLAGPQSADDAADETTYPGSGFGFPERGPGSIAGLGRRSGQFLLDIGLSWLVAAAFFPRPNDGVALRTPQPWASAAIYVIECVVLLLLGGQTAGMRLTGLRVVRLDGRPAGVVATLARTLLTMLLVPILFFDRDLRGLHDRAVGVAVVRTGPGARG